MVQLRQSPANLQRGGLAQVKKVGAQVLLTTPRVALALAARRAHILHVPRVESTTGQNGERSPYGAKMSEHEAKPKTFEELTPLIRVVDANVAREHLESFWEDWPTSNPVRKNAERCGLVKPTTQAKP
jgi:hypothetical protein